MATENLDAQGAVLHDLLNRLSNAEAIVATVHIETNRLATISGNLQADINRMRDSHLNVHSNQMELNGKMEALTAVVTNGRGGGGHGPRQQFVDPKNIKLEIFDGLSKTITFKTWAYKAKAFILGNMPAVRRTIDQTETRKTKIESSELDGLAMTLDQDAQLTLFLQTFTGGHPLGMVKANDNGTGVEMWRQLNAYFDATSIQSIIQETRAIRMPARATSLQKFPEALQEWETQLRRFKERTNKTVDTDECLAIMLAILPDAESKEFNNMLPLYPTYEDMKKQIMDAVQYRTTGPSPMLFNLEEGGEGDVFEMETENGDLELYRIETVNGKRQLVRSKGKGKGKGGAVLCYRCGHTGHISTDCKATKHKLGGPCKPKPPPRKVHNIETEPEKKDEDLGSFDLGSLEAIDDVIFYECGDRFDDIIFHECVDSIGSDDLQNSTCTCSGSEDFQNYTCSSSHVGDGGVQFW